MTRYLALRLVLMVPTALFASLLVFLMMHLIPGDPATSRLGLEASEEAVAQVRHEMGLDQPLLVQYGLWLGEVARGEFGTSWRSGQSAAWLIQQKLPATIALATTSMVVAILVALPLGVLAAIRPRTPFDHLASTFSILGISVPSFWLGIMLVLLLSTQLRWLPPSGYVPFSENPLEALRRLAMPAAVLGFTLAGPLARFVRSGMLEILGLDYIRTARAKGLTEGTVVVRHALRNSLLSVLTVMGIQISGLIGRTVVIEAVFNWPGISLLLLDGIRQRDYGVVQGTVMFIAVAVLTINLIVDLLYGVLDPRIRQA
jgi:peptide/nickel transport system permease protein